MIIQFKIFESYYRTGDYVLLKDPDTWYVYPCVKIVKSGIYTSDNIVKSFKIRSGEIVKFWVSWDEIDRLATKEEIKEFKLKMDAIKYNL